MAGLLTAEISAGENCLVFNREKSLFFLNNMLAVLRVAFKKSAVETLSNVKKQGTPALSGKHPESKSGVKEFGFLEYFFNTHFKGNH